MTLSDEVQNKFQVAACNFVRDTFSISIRQWTDEIQADIGVRMSMSPTKIQRAQNGDFTLDTLILLACEYARELPLLPPRKDIGISGLIAAMKHYQEANGGDPRQLSREVFLAVFAILEHKKYVMLRAPILNSHISAEKRMRLQQQRDDIRQTIIAAIEVRLAKSTVIRTEEELDTLHSHWGAAVDYCTTQIPHRWGL